MPLPRPALLRVLLLAFAVALAPLAAAEPRPFLHPLFSSHGILQRDRPIPVWGWTEADAPVSVKVGTRAWTTRAGRDGRWQVAIGPFSATQGPLALEVEGPQRERIEDVAVGEVWFCSGQSNMFWFLNAVDGAAGELAAANEPGLRLFSLMEKSAAEPLPAPEAIVHRWTPCTSQTASNFSAVAYYFGRELQHRLGVPVGLINSSYGGSTAEAWMSEPAVAGFKEFDDALAALQAARPAIAAGTFDYGKSAILRSPREVPSLAANGMMLPFAGFPVAGIAWYQGESNGQRGPQYRRLLPALIADWRAQWHDPKLPFLIVQLAGYGKPLAQPALATDGWVAVMDAQARTAAEVPGCGLACAYDQGDADDVHPRRKSEVGRRLSYPALSLVYGRKDLPAGGPRIASIRREGAAVRVRFADVGTGLVLRGAAVTTCALQDPAGGIHRATVKIEKDAIIASSPDVADPEKIQFAYEMNPPGELYNSEGLPAIPFREDVPR